MQTWNTLRVLKNGRIYGLEKEIRNNFPIKREKPNVSTRKSAKQCEWINGFLYLSVTTAYKQLRNHSPSKRNVTQAVPEIDQTY